MNKYTNTSSSDRDRLRMYGGQQNHLTVNMTAEAGNYTVPDAYKNCRYLEVDVTGIVKVDYDDDGAHSRTETKIVNAGELWRVPNVTRVYYYYTGTTQMTAQVMLDDGSATVLGVKLRY